jgi:hypothetical protein
MPSAEKEFLTIEPWAAGIALATLLLVGSVAVFTVWDRGRTASIEEAVTPTAVGDMHFVREPAGKKGPIGLKYQGQKLDMVSEHKIRDSKLVRVGTDDSGVYWIYRPADESEGLGKDRFLMKTAVNEYVEVTGE